MRIATLAVAAGSIALTLAAPAAGAIRYTTVAQHVRWPPLSSPQGAHLVARKTQLARITEGLRPQDAARVARVDLRRYLLVAAFTWLPDPCHTFRITRLERKGRTLLVGALRADTGEVQGCIQVIAGGYHVVKVRRSAFAGHIPTRAVLRPEASRPASD